VVGDQLKTGGIAVWCDLATRLMIASESRCHRRDSLVCLAQAGFWASLGSLRASVHGVALTLGRAHEELSWWLCLRA